MGPAFAAAGGQPAEEAPSRSPEFLSVSPNNRTPALADHAPGVGGRPPAVFESGPILLHLGDKTGKFLPADARAKEINTTMPVSDDRSRQVLFGQTASVVR